MSKETESSPILSGVFKVLVALVLAMIPGIGLFILLLLIPWISVDWIGLTLLLSGIVFVVGAGILLESRNVRLWLYSIMCGFLIGFGSIILATLWILTTIPVPLFGNAFYATIIIAASAGLLILWYLPTGRNSPQQGLVSVSSKSIAVQRLSLGGALFQKRDARVVAIELKEIPHEYAFVEDAKRNPKDIIERFHTIIRALATVPFALRFERANRNTRVLFLTWSCDQTQLEHQSIMLYDALSYNLPNFKFAQPDSFEGLVPSESTKGASAFITGVPLSIKDERQVSEPLEAMIGVLQDLENGVLQVFVEPASLSKSKLKSLEAQYRREVEKSETTVSRDKSGWIVGPHQESKTTVNPEAMMKSAILERQIKRLSNPHLYKTTVVGVSWNTDVATADRDARRLAGALAGSLRPDNDHDDFRIRYRTKGREIESLLRGLPIGEPSLLTADEVTAYFILPKTDVGIRVTKREKFSSGTREVQSDAPKERKLDEITSRVSSKVRWRRREPRLYFGNPIDESGKALADVFLRTDVKHLDMHLGVFGNTRSGKSTTVMSLIGQAISLGVNPIILVPSKGYEWRTLLNVFPDVRVFTCGRNDIANLAFNIWAPPQGVRITKWIDRVVQVLTLWLPNDDVISMHIEDVIYTVYKNCGWNLDTNEKGRPILLTDLVDAVRQVSERLDYGNEVSANIYGALVARVKSILRKPSLVNMYNTLTGITVSELLAHPTIIEMDALGENDKILLMGILTAAVCEYKLANPTKEVSNLLVLEEAHYLLSGTDISGEANSGVRLQAVSAFIEMLRVLGGTGLGVILIDQSPSSLVPQAVKIPVNMVIHALSHEDDRRLAGKHSRCTESQIDHIGGMQTGEAVVYLQHEGEPKNVKMFNLEMILHGNLPSTTVDDQRVVEHMRTILEKNPHLRQTEPLPDNIMDRFIQGDSNKKKYPSEILSQKYKEILSQAIVSTEFGEFCRECLDKKDVGALVDLFHAVDDKYGDGSRISLLYVLEFTLDHYGADDDLEIFHQVAVAIDGEQAA